jgi:hypothetical protein
MMQRTSEAVVLVFTLVIGVSGCRSAQKQYLCRARQAEAQANLKALSVAENTYKAQNARYSSSLSELGFSPAESRYYDIGVNSASDSVYSATATGKGEAAGDVWTVDQGGKPSVKVDKCHSE